MEELKYPIGRFVAKENYTIEEIESYKNSLRNFPSDFKNACEGLSLKELETPYRPDGWTAHQVVHHVSDSHGNMLIRLKWTLTEDAPTIKAYYEDRWAQLADYSLPIEVSLAQIEIIHLKVMSILDSLTFQDLEKGYLHPEDGNFYPLKRVVALYAWHGAHHLAHIENCKNK